MISVLRRAGGRVRSDLKLILATPEPHLDAKANENYWAVRRAQMKPGANGFQIDRANWIAARAGPGASILDIGSGTGEMLLILREKGLRPTASDFSSESQAILRGRGFDVIEIDITDKNAVARLPTYDHVSICEVLEHVQSPEDALRTLLSKARTSLFFSVPNTGYFTYRLRLLGGRFPVQWVAHPGEHVRFWTLSDMRWWLRQMGLSERATIKAYQGWPILNRLWPSMFAMGLIVEIKAAPVEQNTPSCVAEYA